MVSVMNTYIKKNFDSIAELAGQAAVRSGRNPGDVQILAVSKTFSAETVQAAIDSGIRLFGENRIQEAQHKISLLHGDFEFHLIGHLQSNKVKTAVSLFEMIHSIDSLYILDKVNIEASKIDKTQKILIQVNTSGEESKNGCKVDAAVDLCGVALALSNVELKGLMTIGPLDGDENANRHSFRILNDLAVQVRQSFSIELPVISMGMSGDFPLAIEEGATLIRVGSAIFGERTLVDG